MSWPFAQPETRVCFTTQEILDQDDWIQWVYLDPEDGSWQFQGEESDEDPVATTLLAMFELFPWLSDLADLPPGWTATRSSPEEAWERSPQFDFELGEAEELLADSESLKRGDEACLVFRIQLGSDIQVERAWVRVKKVLAGYYLGTLNEQPTSTDQLKKGDDIQFAPDHVSEIKRKK